jgi:branched-chain amino acid transport system permease protein
MGAYGLNWLNYRLSSSGNQYALVIIGALLVIVMLFFPRGLVVTLADLVARRSARSEASTARSHGSSPA